MDGEGGGEGELGGGGDEGRGGGGGDGGVGVGGGCDEGMQQREGLRVQVLFEINGDLGVQFKGEGAGRVISFAWWRRRGRER